MWQALSGRLPCGARGGGDDFVTDCLSVHHDADADFAKLQTPDQPSVIKRDDPFLCLSDQSHRFIVARVLMVPLHFT